MRDALKKKKKKSAGHNGLPEIKSRLTQIFRNTTMVIHANMRLIHGRIEVGEMTPKDAEQFLIQARRHLTSLNAVVEDWEKRTVKLKEE